MKHSALFNVMSIVSILGFWYYSVIIAANDNLQLNITANYILYQIFSILPLVLLLPSCISGKNNGANCLSTFVIILAIIVGNGVFSYQGFEGSTKLYHLLIESIYPILICIFIYRMEFDEKSWFPDSLILTIVLLFGYTYYIVLRETILLLDDYAIWISVYSIAVLPLGLNSKNRYVKYLTIAISLFAIITNSKRTAFIAFFLCIAVFYIVKYLTEQQSSSKKVLGVLFILISIYIGGYIYVYYSDDAMLQRFMDIRDDKGSGRLDIYEDIIRSYCNQGLYNQVFGSGYLETIKVAGRSAHNDFLEILYDFGIVGLIPYLLFHLRLIKLGFRGLRMKTTMAPVLLSSYMVFLVFSLSSIVIINSVYSVFIFEWAFALNKNNNKIIDI